MEIERAIEILNPEHREHYDSIETLNEACRMGMRSLGKEKEKNKMEKIKVMLDDGAKMPTRAHDTDADRDTMQAYIRAKLYKRQPEREELVPIPGGWKYTIYEG